MTDREDMPKVIATIMWTSPGLVLRSGFAYLRMRKMARRSSQQFMDALIRGGIPPEMARQLSDKYAVDLSVKRLVGGLRISGADTRERQSAGK
ncbi:MAG: hypothetical protein JW880_06665 [Candidatus Thermoplasmatota archaeon]|nr:hypothetical protein [Candidatus Thermoplasmatota archaeon]